MNERDREKAFEEMLRRTLRLRSSAPASECPASDLLAAYFGHALSVDEKTQLDSHFSACERCRQTLATLAKAEEQPAVFAHVVAAPMPALPAHAAIAEVQEAAVLHCKAAPARPRPLVNWRWLAPAAAVAAAVVLWFSLRPAPTTDQARPSPGQIASRPATPADEAPTAPQANQLAGRTDAQRQLGKKADSTVALNSSGGALSDSARRSDLSSARKPLQGSVKTSEAAKLAPQPAMPPSETGKVVARVAPEPPRAEYDQLAQEQKLPAQASAGLSQASSTQLALAANMNEKHEALRESKELARTDQSKPSPRPLLALDAKNGEKKNPEAFAPAPSPGAPAVEAFRTKEAETPSGKMDRSFLRLGQVSAPGSITLWRFGPAGTIERSRDSGHSWQPQASPVTTELLSGSAPAENVCWIVGRSGTILRTTDGEKWEKVHSPAEKDWLAVVASSTRTATITSQDSQRYSTADGGRTWRRK